MLRLQGSAVSSGHVTLLFSIDDNHDDPLDQGSRGVGLCIEGTNPVCEVSVSSEPGSGNVSGTGSVDIYRTTLEIVAASFPEVNSHDWYFVQNRSLPTQQGFGLSASASMASALALLRAIGIDDEEARPMAFAVAHLVERSMSGGLGDVSAMWAGGVDLRRVAGSPTALTANESARGVVDGWHLDIPMVVAWRATETKQTGSYIDDIEWKKAISAAGESELKSLQQGNWNSERWQEILTASTRFAENSGLASDSNRTQLLSCVNEAASNLETKVSCHLCMLGESVVILPASLDYNLSESDRDQLVLFLESQGMSATKVSLSEDCLR